MQCGLREDAERRALDASAAALEFEAIAQCAFDRAIDDLQIRDVARLDQPGLVARRAFLAIEGDALNGDVVRLPDGQDRPWSQSDEPA